MCGARTVLHGALPRCCHSYKSGGFSSVTACAGKAVGIRLCEGQTDKWNAEKTKRQACPSVLIGAPGVRQAGDTELPLPFVLQRERGEVGSHWSVIRLPENCCTMLLDMLKSVLYLVSDAGPIFWKGSGLFGAHSEQPAVPCHSWMDFYSQAGLTSIELSRKAEGNSPCHDVVQDRKSTASRAK